MLYLPPIHLHVFRFWGSRTGEHRFPCLVLKLTEGTRVNARGQRQGERVHLQNFSCLVVPAVLKYIAVCGLSLTEIFWILVAPGMQLLVPLPTVSILNLCVREHWLILFRLRRAYSFLALSVPYLTPCTCPVAEPNSDQCLAASIAGSCGSSSSLMLLCP